MSAKVAFYVTTNNFSVLLSCVTILALGLIQSHTRLDYLPPRSSLITSSADHPKKTKSQVQYPEKNLKCLQYPTKKVWFPCLLQARIRFLKLIEMCLMVMDAFLVPNTISKLILVLQPSKPLGDQSQCILKSPSSKKQIKCYQLEF